MRRIIIFCLLGICIPSESFGEGIFGLKKGMTLDEIKELDFGRMEQYGDDPFCRNGSSPHSNSRHQKIRAERASYAT